MTDAVITVLTVLCTGGLFAVLHGDWYMTALFNKWLADNDVGKPEWFTED